MIRLVNYIRDLIQEQLWLKDKPCAACRYFAYYMGTAGICLAKRGCPATRMKDCNDYCDCGCFKRERR